MRPNSQASGCGITSVLLTPLTSGKAHRPHLSTGALNFRGKKKSQEKIMKSYFYQRLCEISTPHVPAAQPPSGKLRSHHETPLTVRAAWKWRCYQTPRPGLPATRAHRGRCDALWLACPLSGNCAVTSLVSSDILRVVSAERSEEHLGPKKGLPPSLPPAEPLVREAALPAPGWPVPRLQVTHPSARAQVWPHASQSTDLYQKRLRPPSWMSGSSARCPPLRPAPPSDLSGPYP